MVYKYLYFMQVYIEFSFLIFVINNLMGSIYFKLSEYKYAMNINAQIRKNRIIIDAQANFSNA